MKKIILILLLLTGSAKAQIGIQLGDSITSSRPAVSFYWGNFGVSQFELSQILLTRFTAADSFRVYAILDTFTASTGNAFPRDTVPLAYRNLTNNIVDTGGYINVKVSPMLIEPICRNVPFKILIKSTDVTLSGTIDVRALGVTYIKP